MSIATGSLTILLCMKLLRTWEETQEWITEQKLQWLLKQATGDSDQSSQAPPEFEFLSEAELVEWTGYKRKSKQIEWLKKHGYPFAVDRLGHPKVLRDDIKRREIEGQKTHPNWGALPEKD
jgi:Domain of unknown function (DUF4224)